MSDEEEQYSEEEEEEIEEGGGAEKESAGETEQEEVEETKVRRPPPRQEDEEDGSSMSEAERAMLAAKKRHEDDAAMKLLDYEERRKIEREREEEELRLLKQRQEERKKQREEEEREFNERRKKDEEKRKAEEEERRQKMEADKKRRDEEKRKRQGMVAELIGVGGDGPNFKVEKKSGDDKADKFSNIVQAKQEMRMTKEQADEAKRVYLSIVARTVDISAMLPNDLKDAIKKLHGRIMKIEADKYDLEKRQERQEYDLKELSERQRQAARNRALTKGIDPADAVNTRYPPKIAVASKFDRQVDRRGFGDKREQFENPYDPPPKAIAHGSGRPPTEWGRKENEELENLRKVLEPPKYVEQAPIEGAKPPVPVIPLQIPQEEFDPTLAEKLKKKQQKLEKLEQRRRSSVKAAAERRRSSAKSATGAEPQEGQETEEPQVNGIAEESEEPAPEPEPEPAPAAEPEPEEEEEEEENEEAEDGPVAEEVAA